MPTKTTITINSTNDGKKVTDNINYVNPNISDANALLLAQKINALTNNTYASTDRTDKRNLSDITPRTFTDIRYGFTGNPNKALPDDGIINCLTTDWSRIISGNTGYYAFNLRFWGVEDPVVPTWEFSSNGDTAWHTNSFSYGYPTSRWSIDMVNVGLCTEDMDAMVPQTLTAKLTFPATANFDEWSKTFTIIITEPEG